MLYFNQFNSMFPAYSVTIMLSFINIVISHFCSISFHSCCLFSVLNKLYAHTWQKLFSPVGSSLTTFWPLWPQQQPSLAHQILRYVALLKWRANSFWVTVCKTVRPMLSDHCLTVCPVCDVDVLWPNSRMDQDETWHTGRPQPWPHCARWGPSSPSPKGAQPPIFGPYLLLPNVWMYQDATW